MTVRFCGNSSFSPVSPGNFDGVHRVDLAAVRDRKTRSSNDISRTFSRVSNRDRENVGIVRLIEQARLARIRRQA